MTAGFGALKIEIRVSAVTSFLVPDAIRFGSSISAGRLGAFGSGSRRAGALAFVIHVAWRAATRFRGAFRVAAVHQIDHLSVGKGDALRYADAQLIILIFGQNRESASLGKGPGTVLHDAAVVVGDADVVDVELLVKVVVFGGRDVLVDDDEALVAVFPRLLVMEADDVA